MKTVAESSAMTGQHSIDALGKRSWRPLEFGVFEDRVGGACAKQAVDTTILQSRPAIAKRTGARPYTHPTGRNVPRYQPRVIPCISDG